MRSRSIALAAGLAAALFASVLFSKPAGNKTDGQFIFRFDTFGDEQLWTDILRMHEVVQSAVSPRTALAVGLKVDSTVLPPNFLSRYSLDDPATTVELLRRNAVVGIVAKVEDRNITSLGITCALCHSTVDNSVAPGVGQRLDGWPNRDLDPGRIIALSPALTPDQKAVYNSWGPGRYDPRFNQDHVNGPVLIPPAYGLQNVPLEIYTGDGPISYWNNYVAVTQMGGQGSFCDPRLPNTCVSDSPDLVVPKLPALLEYQLSLQKPAPAPGSFDTAAAARGQAIFNGACASCHAGTTYTDAPTLHEAAETGMDPAYAQRSATKKYRTTPLRALWQHAPYFHDGSAADLLAVVNHYNGFFGLGLTEAQKADLVEYLKSL
jgi:mono/diheme cytochrome c family protein